MIQSLLQMRDTTPMPEMCVRLGEVLGMDKPVPMPVLLRDRGPGFAADLITSRGQPGFLAALFDDRRTRAYAPSALAADAPSATALAGKAAAAMLRWGKAGFSTVDSETLERRESACLGCPNLADPRARCRRWCWWAPSPTRSAAGWAARSATCAAAWSTRRSACPRRPARTRTRSSPA